MLASTLASTRSQFVVVLEGVSPTESGLLNAYFANEPLAQVLEKIEICASTPKGSTVQYSILFQ